MTTKANGAESKLCPQNVPPVNDVLKIKELFRDQLPPLPEDKYRKLEKDICEKGCFDPIRTWRGYVIDGHHRYKICMEHNVSFLTLSLDDTLGDEDSVRIWMIDHQDGRRELRPFVRAELQMEKDRIKSRQRNNQHTKGLPVSNESIPPPESSGAEKSMALPYEQSAKQAGMSESSFSRACYIAEHASEEDKQKLRDEKEKDSINSIYSKLKNEEKARAIKANLESIAVKEIKATEGVYDVITIDPPWEITNWNPKSDKYGYMPLAYPTMTLDEIKGLNVPYSVDCHVFLWTTQKFLPKSFEILDSWDLEYVCTFTWVKNGGPQSQGLPQYDTEFFIYARKGKPKFVDTKSFFTALTAKRSGHSAKPEEFYDLLKRVTAGRRLDMFNRRKIEGFDVWGNQADPKEKQHA